MSDTHKKEGPMLTGNYASGGIGILLLLRDLVTFSERSGWTQSEVLVVLDEIGHSDEIFPPGSYDSISELWDRGIKMEENDGGAA